MLLMQDKLIVSRGVNVSPGDTDAKLASLKDRALHSCITGSRNATQFIMNGYALDAVLLGR